MTSAAIGPHRRAALWRAAAGLGAVTSLVVLSTASQISGAQPFLIVGLSALVALTVWSTERALLVLACVVPVIRTAGRSWEPYAAWSEMVVVSVAAGWFIRRAFSAASLVQSDPDDRSPADDLNGPIAVAAGVVIASLAVVTALAQWRITGRVLSSVWLRTYAHGYFLMESSGDALDTAMRILESLLLFRITSIIAREKSCWAPRVAAAIVAGAALAAIVNLYGLWSAALQQPAPFQSWLRLFASERLNVHYGDLNAAGSYFVMTLAVAAGYALHKASRWWAAPAAAVIAAGLWVSGSRAAIVAGFVATLVPLGARLRAARIGVPRPAIVLSAAVLLAAAALTAYWLPLRGNQRSANDALRVRYELTLTSLRMVATAPVFGVGVGNYYTLSGQFASPELLVLFPPARQENAHNNFLQMVAEFGLVGAAAFAWLGWAAARRLTRLVRDDERDPPRWGIVIGVTAFAVSCLGGHPLLLDEPAFTFWLLLGAGAGWGGAALGVPTPTLVASAATNDDLHPARRRVPRFVRALGTPAAIVGIVLATIPMRWYAGRAQMDLENVAFGLTGWYTGRDGVPYRLSGRTSTIYVRNGYRGLRIPIKATPPHTEVEVTFRIDGAVADIVRVRSDRWQVVPLIVPTGYSWSRFRPLAIEVMTPALAPRVLFIGRISPF
jgi:hypothetical protein